MNLRQAAQQALEAMIEHGSPYLGHESAYQSAITALRAALAEQDRLAGIEAIEKDAGIHVSQQAEPEQQPVAWLITDEKINSLQVASIQRLIDRAKHAHHTDVLLRINGTNERYEADWLKHMTRTAPTPRKPLTYDELEPLCEAFDSYDTTQNELVEFARAIERAHGITGNSNE